MKNQIFGKFAKFAVCVLLCLAIGSQCLVFGAVEITKPNGEIEPRIDELLELYLKYSLYDLTREEAIEAMLKNFLINNPDITPYLGDSLLTAFDPYGGYYPETTLGEFFSGVYRGFGIALGGRETIDGMKYYAVVDRVFDESPADKAGVQNGDEIIRVDGVDLEGLGVNAVSHFLAECPDQISLTVRRGGKELNFSITRSAVFVQSVSLHTNEEKKIALITIDDFLDEYMAYDIYAIVDFLVENGYKNVIFDLRGNPGGDLMNMLETLNMFVPEKGVTLYTEIDKNGKTESIESTGDGVAFDRICVLANSQSASAAELFALSLRDIAGAFIIGEKTHGKGIGQYYESMSNGDLVAITAFEVLSANGTGYHGVGVEPDIKISPAYTEVKRKTFGQLNFVNCQKIRAGADNDAVLALNQRLAAIGYIQPKDAGSKCTDKTVTAVEIFQKYNGLPVGIAKIDYVFIEYLNFYADYYFVGKYETHDVQLECADIYMQKGEKAAREFAEKLKVES